MDSQYIKVIYKIGKVCKNSIHVPQEEKFSAGAIEGREKGISFPNT